MKERAIVLPQKIASLANTSVQDGLLRRKCACGGTPGPTGECEECRKKRSPLQRHASNQDQVTTILPLVHEVLRSTGQPLDFATRSTMESRFHHDFSRVRVHTDARAAESAGAVDALAYTVNQDLVFAPGQYQPDTGAGRMLIAHELAHTIQQRNGVVGSATEDPTLERAADNAAAAAVFNRAITLSSTATPAIQFVKVTSGALGKALEVFTNLWKVPDKAIFLLQKSPSFLKVAATIDSNYVWRGDSYKIDPSGETGPDRRLIKGPFKGKRELFDVLQGKPVFEPFEAPPEPGKIKVSGDVIQIESTDIPGFIQEIAHEATHAARFVSGTGPPPQTIVDEVNAAVTDEVETRKSEAKILGEIPAADVKARVATVGTRVPAEVERDISPAFGLTYLENAFFGRRLREAQTKDGITDNDTEKIRDEIEKEFQGKTLPTPHLRFKPQLGSSGLYELSDYGKIWFNRRLAQKEWEAFQQNNKPSDPDFATEKEKLVQDHAKRFLEGRVTYQPLPKRLPPPPLPPPTLPQPFGPKIPF